MSNVKVGVVGCGHLGRHHARILSGIDGVELVAIVDVDLARAEEYAKEYNSTAYSDYRDILGKVDAASIVVPTSSHFEVSSAFLKAGAHLLVEKPICKTVEDASMLVEMAHDCKRILQVGHIERFNSAVVALKKHITKPMFIESHRIGPFAARGTDVDVILDLMIHDIDIILSLVQSEVVHVHATGVPVISSNIDIANARLHFASGCVANVTASRISLEQVRKIRIFQPQNYISLNYKDQSLATFELKDIANSPIPDIEIEEIDIDKSEPLKAELEAFIKSVIKGSKVEVSGVEGREALKVALMVTNEIRNGLKKLNY